MHFRYRLQKLLGDHFAECHFNSSSDLRGDKKTGKIWKPSILDGQNAFACHVEVITTFLFFVIVTNRIFQDLKNIPSLIDKRKEKYSGKLHCIQPFILLVGDSPETSERVYIFFNDILYEAENLLKGISVTYQMHFVLNIQYAKECSQVWNFIQEHFYEMSTNGDTKTSALHALLNQLK